MKEYFGFVAPSLEKELVEMAPREYFQKIMPGASIINTLSYIDKEKAKKYSELMKNGEKFPVPEIIIYSNVILHEGRHRVYAAMSLELEKVPVYIINKEEEYFETWA